MLLSLSLKQYCTGRINSSKVHQNRFEMTSPSHPFYKRQSPSPELRARFQSVPWAWKLFDDPTLQPFITEARVLKSESTADTFVSNTLATEDTIKAWQSFYKAPDSVKKYGEVLCLLSLGSGINGHIDTSHGGFISLIHDEGLGLAAETVRPPDKTTMTAYLRVDYKKPLRTPNVVLCRAWAERREGRKLYVKGSMEDGNGNVVSVSEGLFIVVDRAKIRENL